MDTNQITVATECARLSASGRIHFGEVVGRLTKVGTERYHADYSRMENTYYAAGAGSCVVPMEHAPMPIAHTSSAEKLEAALRQSERREIMCPEFTRQALEAGCVGYFVQISGKRVQYFVRKREIHTEWFPGASPT